MPSSLLLSSSSLSPFPFPLLAGGDGDDDVGQQIGRLPSTKVFCLRGEEN